MGLLACIAQTVALVLCNKQTLMLMGISKNSLSVAGNVGLFKKKQGKGFTGLFLKL